MLEYLSISHGRGNISRRGEISNNIIEFMINNMLEYKSYNSLLHIFLTVVIATNQQTISNLR